jgi:hypothetical protein
VTARDDRASGETRSDAIRDSTDVGSGREA